MRPIFTYGSLMFDAVWSKLVSRHYPSQKAVLHGYARRCVIGEEYPVIYEADEYVQGIVYHNVLSSDIERLDYFEGEYYTRKTVMLDTQTENPFEADVYVLRKEYFHIIDEQIWDEEAFSKEGLNRFLNAYKGFMS